MGEVIESYIYMLYSWVVLCCSRCCSLCPLLCWYRKLFIIISSSPAPLLLCDGSIIYFIIIMWRKLTRSGQLTVSGTITMEMSFFLFHLTQLSLNNLDFNSQSIGFSSSSSQMKLLNRLGLIGVATHFEHFQWSSEYPGDPEICCRSWKRGLQRWNLSELWESIRKQGAGRGIDWRADYGIKRRLRRNRCFSPVNFWSIVIATEVKAPIVFHSGGHIRKEADQSKMFSCPRKT